MKKKTTALKKALTNKRLSLLALLLFTSFSLTGCNITWEDLDTVLVNPRNAITDVGARNKSILDDYRRYGLITEVSAEQYKKAIDDKVESVVKNPNDFVKSIEGSLVHAKQSTDEEKVLLQDKLSSPLPETATNPQPIVFMDKGFYEDVIKNINKRIFVLNPNLKPEDFDACVKACEEAMAYPNDPVRIGALTSQENSFFIDSGQTLHQYTQDDILEISSESGDTAIGVSSPANDLNKDLGIQGLVEYETVDDKGNKVKRTKTEVVLTLRVQEFSKSFADTISSERVTKGKYLMPQVTAGGDTGLDSSSMNLVFLMEYPVKVVNKIQLGDQNTQAQLGADSWSFIFDNTDLKVNLATGEMLWKNKVVNNETDAKERIYRVTHENSTASEKSSFAFYDDGGNQTVTDATLKDTIKLTGLADTSYNPDAFPDELDTKTAYNSAYILSKFNTTITHKTINGNTYAGVDIDGNKVWLRYHEIKGDAPSIIQQRWKSPGGKADEVYEYQQKATSGILSETALKPSIIGSYNKTSYTNGPTEGTQSITDKSGDLESIVSNTDYTELTTGDGSTTSYFDGYFKSKTVYPGSPSLRHINWNYTQFGGFTEIPTRQELGLSEDQYKVFLSSPEIFNVARKYNEDNLEAPKIEINEGDYQETDWCSVRSLYYFFPEYTISNSAEETANINKTLTKDEIDPDKIRKEGSKYIYEYEGIDYYCTNPYASAEVNSATIILTDYLELTYMPGVYPNGNNVSEDETEPFIATGRRVKLTKTGGTTTEGADTTVAIFADKYGKPIVNEDNQTINITIDDLVDYSSGVGYYKSVAEKLGIGGLTNTLEVQSALDGQDRDGKLKDLFETTQGGTTDEGTGLTTGASGLIEDEELLKYDAYFTWIRPCLMFALEGSENGDRPSLAAADQSNMANVFWGLCVNTNAFRTNLYTGWIDKTGDGGDIGSLSWWNGWLRKHNYVYYIDPAALKGAMEKAYADSIASKDNTIIFNMNTINKINEVLESREEKESKASRSTVFTILGIALISYGFLLSLFWVIDTNLVNGPGLLSFATAGHFQAIVSKDDAPFYSDSNKTCVTLVQLLCIVLGIWVFGAILILTDVTAIWGLAMELLGNIANEIKKLMFNMM